MSLRLLFYGDSNTYGYIPGGGRLPKEERFPVLACSLLSKELSVPVLPLEEGLNGRNSAWSAPGDEFLLGGATFAAILAKNLPIHGLVCMLGTNDLFPPLELSTTEIVANLRALLTQAKQMVAALPILLLSPVPLSPSGIHLSICAYDCREEILSQDLTSPLCSLARELGISFLPGEAVIPFADASDGTHLTAKAHHALGQAVATSLAFMLSAPPQRP